MQTIYAIALCGVLAIAAQPGKDSRISAGSGADISGVSTSVYALSFHPEAGALPPGAIYVCRARIMPGARTEKAAKDSGLVPGNQFGCALEVPFAWEANHPQPAVALSYEVDTVSTDGRVLHSVARNGVALPPPVAGSSAHIELTF
jgi:hypothetical protein